MKTHVRKGVLLLLMLFLLSFTLYSAYADPAGGTVSSNTTSTASTVAPGVQNTSRGTITTMVLNSLQQDQHWKAYVGNVTGSLTLDNANNYTIYAWDLTTITGQVYASRFNNLTWTSVSCANQTNIIDESTFNNMTVAKPDRINTTFNWTIHKSFQVGGTTITNSTCNSTVTYVNDSRRVPNESSTFQEVLIKDANNQFMYMTDISDNSQGFDNENYDFQMIVAESDVKTTPTAYYFYVELR
jgi:hypothetical protein